MARPSDRGGKKKPRRADLSPGRDEMVQKDKISRRDLIKTGAVAGAAAAAGSLASPNVATAQAQGLPARWDREVDVVVIGSGAAGMPAAIAAREAGSSVILSATAPSIADTSVTWWSISASC